MQVLAAEAVTHLAELGVETFVRAQRATRLQHGEIYRDPAGQRYGVAVEQRCWVLSKMAGIRNGEGPWMDSSVLLLADGKIGRFWPIPPRAPADPGRGAPADDGRLYVGRATRSPISPPPHYDDDHGKGLPGRVRELRGGT